MTQTVHHPRHGTGHVMMRDGRTAVVRFAHGIEQVLLDELTERLDPAAALRAGVLAPSIDGIVKAQALAIASCNEQWGVYSRSRIQLLPHQLWVCRQVLRSWPFRWLIADDVGLGKTIEAGLVMMPLTASGRARRVLVLAPAKLVPQWRQRLKDMFDLRFQAYAPETDRGGAFWDAADMVVGSMHTLRSEERRRGLLEAEPWDLVVVDEAHHMSLDERGSATLSYDLVREMEERGCIRSLLLFTGTPHRGKDAAFFGLMQLVRPDLFDPRAEPGPQYARLSEAMIRNNKATVTDLKGERLFKPVRVHAHEFGYGDAEAEFYRTMSAFILDGRAYADTMDARGASARMLLLTALQKLAASSVAAIRAALGRRRTMLALNLGQSGRVADNLAAEPADDATLDEVAEAEESLPGGTATELMRGEIARIDELLALADAVDRQGGETKVSRLLALIGDGLPAGEPVLLFTEYKATQALVLAALERRFGRNCATFINGDERLAVAAAQEHEPTTLSVAREDAAADFNAGRVRFLVSTEAGGEGIDLQERCATLIHVDMPWNPMRMHQRVGRLSRYGQTREVDVHILRNPDTVEARIWALLDAKLERIQAAFSSVMDDQEDIRQLVVGMAGRALFDDVFAGALGRERGLRDWFDARTARLDGRDIVDTVRDMFGHVRRFDFNNSSGELPKSDLPDLDSFMRLALRRHGRRMMKENMQVEQFAIVTPDPWCSRDYAVRKRYAGLVFDRGLRGRDAAAHVLGVGHALVDAALAEARELDASAVVVDGLDKAMAVLTVEDRVTDTGSAVRQIVFGVSGFGGDREVLRDWEMLKRINKARPFDGDINIGMDGASADAWLQSCVKTLEDVLPQHETGMREPAVRPLVALLPR